MTERLTTAQVKDYKETLWDEQGHVCPLCNRELELDDFHLDHSHDDTGELFPGKVRAALCYHCNPTAGIMIHKFNRSGLRKHLDFLTWFKRLVEYLDADYSDMPYHPLHKIPEEEERLKLRRKLKTLKRKSSIEETQARIKELNEIIRSKIVKYQF